MVKPYQIVIGIVIGILISFVYAFSQTHVDRKDGKTYVHIVKQEGENVLLQPITPALLGFTMENGQLNGQKFLECDEWTVYKTKNGVDFPTLQLRCSGIVMTLGSVLMTQPEYPAPERP
jgi:hypothetical protein